MPLASQPPSPTEKENNNEEKQCDSPGAGQESGWINTLLAGIELEDEVDFTCEPALFDAGMAPEFHPTRALRADAVEKQLVNNAASMEDQLGMDVGQSAREVFPDSLQPDT